MLSSGPVDEVLIASAAIPGVFPPVELDGKHLIDGGISSNTPLSAAVELGAKIRAATTGMDAHLERLIQEQLSHRTADAR